MKLNFDIIKTTAAGRWSLHAISLPLSGSLLVAGLLVYVGLSLCGYPPAPPLTPIAPVRPLAIKIILPDIDGDAEPIERKENPDSDRPSKTPENRFHPIIVKAATRYDVDPALIKAIIKAESGYNARAVSKKGAMGLMQLMPATAAELGVEDSLDPEHNINGGVRYFRKLMDQFEGDIRLALAAYNAGSRKVRHYQGVPPFKATQYYLKKVFKYYKLYRNQTNNA